MRLRKIAVTVVAVALAFGGAAVAAVVETHHIHLTTSNATEAVKWYVEHLDCTAIEGRINAVGCAGVEIHFAVQLTLGASQGTGIDHIGFSYADLDAKMAELEAIGVAGSGVRLQRFEDGETVRSIPGLFKIAFVFDPWGTRIELVEDPETLGFHHVHLQSADPGATLAWYRDHLGGEPASLKGMIDGVLFGDVWILVSQQVEGRPAPTPNRAIDHIGFVVADLGPTAKQLKRDGVGFAEEPNVPEKARGKAKRAYLEGPDDVRIALVEPSWAGVEVNVLGDVRTVAALESYDAPRTPWGEPDLQGMWTGDPSHGIPLERPEELAGRDSLTAEEAAARRERGTLGSIWGYEREWRDTTLGMTRSAMSTQVAMVIDPPDGRLPPLTAEGQRRAEEAAAERQYSRRLAEGPEDLTPYVRCITRGLPGMMMPGVYNNGLQISQSPGHVAVQKEMIHETRVIPTSPRPHLPEGIQQWLGNSRGHWEGDTLVVEVKGFNGKAPYQGAGENLTLTERFTRVAPDLLEYRFTVDDPTIWTRPWTGMFYFGLGEEQYELVEYACHEGNYGMTNILSGARAREREAAASSAAAKN